LVQTLLLTYLLYGVPTPPSMTYKLFTITGTIFTSTPSGSTHLGKVLIFPVFIMYKVVNRFWWGPASTGPLRLPTRASMAMLSLLTLINTNPDESYRKTLSMLRDSTLGSAASTGCIFSADYQMFIFPEPSLRKRVFVFFTPKYFL